MSAMVVSLSAMVVIGAAETIHARPDFSRFAELFPHETASVPIPDPLSAALKDIRSIQQQNADTLQQNRTVLQQNTAMLQQGAANLESIRQGFTAQQTNLKIVSN